MLLCVLSVTNLGGVEMKEKDIKLLPCPFCGGKAEFVKMADIRHKVRCSVCGTIAGFGTRNKNNELNAINWNMRVN